MPDEWEEERINNRTPNFTVNLWIPKEYYNCPQVRLKLYTLQIQGYCTREGLIHNNIVLCLLQEKKKKKFEIGVFFRISKQQEKKLLRKNCKWHFPQYHM